MKSRIRYSRLAMTLTILIYLVLFAGCFATLHDRPDFFIILSIYVVMLAMALFFGAVYIEVDSERIILGSIFRSKKIFMRDVADVEPFQPTMGARRICGSAGFMGYWGIFREGDIGRYYAFYGKASDCFLVRMKNGDKYVLGCENSSAMVAYIKSQVSGAASEYPESRFLE